MFFSPPLCQTGFFSLLTTKPFYGTFGIRSKENLWFYGISLRKTVLKCKVRLNYSQVCILHFSSCIVLTVLNFILHMGIFFFFVNVHLLHSVDDATLDYSYSYVGTVESSS